MRYLKHDVDASTDERVVMLMMKCGYRGYGLFWRILEAFGKAEKPIRVDVLKRLTGVSDKRYHKEWQTLVDVGLIKIKGEDAFNTRIESYAGEYNFNRKRNHERVDKFRSAEKEEVAKPVTHYTDADEKKSNAPEHLPVTGANGIEEKNNRTRKETLKQKVSERDTNHLFSESPFFNKEKFIAAFDETDYVNCDLNYYYERVRNWGASSGKRKMDWIAVARNFMLGDAADKTLKLKHGASIGNDNDEGLSKQERYVREFKKSAR